MPDTLKMIEVKLNYLLGETDLNLFHLNRRIIQIKLEKYFIYGR